MFYDHFFDPNLKKNILELLTVRKKHGINAKSEVRWRAVVCCLHWLLSMVGTCRGAVGAQSARHPHHNCEVLAKLRGPKTVFCPASPALAMLDTDQPSPHLLPIVGGHPQGVQ